MSDELLSKAGWAIVFRGGCSLEIFYGCKKIDPRGVPNRDIRTGRPQDWMFSNNTNLNKQCTVGSHISIWKCSNSSPIIENSIIENLNDDGFLHDEAVKLKTPRFEKNVKICWVSLPFLRSCSRNVDSKDVRKILYTLYFTFMRGAHTLNMHTFRTIRFSQLNSFIRRPLNLICKHCAL